MNELQELAAIVAEAAKAELLPRFAVGDAERKADGSLVTAADTGMQARLTRELQARWPGRPLLGEEMPEEDQQRLMAESTDGLWCLDPLDGTSNFVAGIPFFAVSLALLRNGGVELGLVYDPLRDECFTAAAGQGAWLDGAQLSGCAPGTELERGIAIIDYKRLPKELSVRLVSEPPFASQRNLGASALEWCQVAAGRCHAYLHGGQKLWDYAAGGLILAEAGGVAETLDGRPVFRGALESSSAVAAPDRRLFDQWRSWLDKT